MTCLSRHSSKKSSECRLSCKAGKKVSWVQSTASSLSLSASFGVSSSAAAKRDIWFVREPPGVTVHSLGPSPWEDLQGFRAAVNDVDPSVSLTVSESGHTPLTLSCGEHTCRLIHSGRCTRAWLLCSSPVTTGVCFKFTFINQ